MLWFIIVALLLIVVLVPYIIIVENSNAEDVQQNEDDKTTSRKENASIGFPYYAILPVIVVFTVLVSLWSCLCIKNGFYGKKRSEWLDQNREMWNKLSPIFSFYLF